MSVHSIQVDGGSEFCAGFEQACADRDIPLIVLPPKRPQYNGCVGRATRTVRQESTPITQVNRPHQALDAMTPGEYFQQWMAT